MNKFIVAFITGLGILLAGCGPAPILPSAPIPTLPPLPSLVAPATATPAPTVGPSSTSTSFTSASTASPTSGAVTQTISARTSLTPTLTLTTRVATTTTATTPTSAAVGAPPGVYITDLKVEPNPPNRSADLIFSPVFVNSMGTPQTYRWVVYIYKTDNPSRSTGETPPAQTAIPVGTGEQRAGGTWKYGPGSQCDFFFVRIGSLDQDRKITFFTRPDGKLFEKNLTLCP